jgi:predicted SAM-dependent methyltransferase
MPLKLPFSRSRPAAGGVPRYGVRLHVGAGRERMDGWVNVDIQDLPGVDVVADVTRGLDFTAVEAIYAEHFLEHLPLDAAVDFLLECHRVLAPGRWLRLSTPNLDWVWATHYPAHVEGEARARQALIANRAFHCWRHRFLWNREMLGRALAACGFDDVRWCRYGESGQPELAGLERHETYEDAPDLPHVVIAEARKGAPAPEALAELRQEMDREFLSLMYD